MGEPLAFLYVVVSSGGHWITSSGSHQLFLWPQQTLQWCLFFSYTAGPTSASLAAGAKSQEPAGVGPKLIIVSIDFPFPIPPLSLCWGALSHRRLCSGLQRRWDFRKIEHTKTCDKLQWQGCDGRLWWSEIKSPTKQYCFILCLWGPLLGLDWERKSEEESKKDALTQSKGYFFPHSSDLLSSIKLQYNTYLEMW